MPGAHSAARAPCRPALWGGGGGSQCGGVGRADSADSVRRGGTGLQDTPKKDKRWDKNEQGITRGWVNV